MKFLQFYVSYGLLLLSSLLFIANSDSSYEVPFRNAVDAYNKQRWHECKSEMENAIDSFNAAEKDLLQCRVSCNIMRSSVDSSKYFELSFFEIALKKSDCLRRCMQQHGANEFLLASLEVAGAFERKMPYDYLQICAFKTGDLQKAASAAYTFLLANPDHEIMQSNIEFYQSQPDIDPSWFVDLEAKQYQKLYINGVEQYTASKWKEAIQSFEEAIQEFLLEVNRCQRSCEGPVDHGTQSLSFYNAIADHWASVVQCQATCDTQISHVNGAAISNMLAEMYHYLQFCYYKIHDYNSAAECTSSSLLLDPENETVLKNKRFYLNKGIHEQQFTPRREVIDFDDMMKQYRRQSEYVSNKYKFTLEAYDSPPKVNFPSFKNNAGVSITGSSYPNPLANETVLGERNSDFLQDLAQYNEERGLAIAMESDDLEGKYRVATDGFLSVDECTSLMALASKGATKGDGYKNESPHTVFEKFEGLTISKAAELAVEGSVSVDEAQKYLNITENARAFLEKYYNLRIPLFFHYTHLVCRTALAGKTQNGRQDLSHPVHSDNCYVQADGNCLREPPAYVQRDFSGIIYLNDEFEGGDFFFANKDDSVQKTVRPKCGRMVAFESSDFHGVLPVTSGRRCAIAVWYTLDRESKEGAHEAAQALINAKVTKQLKLQNAVFDSLMQEKKMSLAQTEVELNGPERFTADGLLSDDQCKMLIELANKGATVGDGYGTKTGQTSPHTQHEYFAGLRVDRAAELGAVTGDGYLHASPHTHNEMLEGLSLLRAAQLAADGSVDPSAVSLYLNASADSLNVVKSYFNMDKDLFFDFTHLVCRTATDDENHKREDLSHPVHSDNCIMQPDNSCIKEPPAYTERDYTALLYLNDNFEGGEFFFAHKDFSIQSTLKPKCGRLVGFNASNYHGVKAVLSGQRCALAMWFTLDEKYKEAAHTVASDILSKLKTVPAKEEL